MTQFIFGLVEIPARSLVLLVLPWSRRLSQSGFLALGGIACLLMLTVPEGMVECMCVSAMCSTGSVCVHACLRKSEHRFVCIWLSLVSDCDSCSFSCSGTGSVLVCVCVCVCIKVVVHSFILFQ